MKKLIVVRFIPLLLAVLLLGGVAALAAATAPNLGTAINFAVLAGSGITDTTPSVIVGSAGSSPTFTNGLTNGEVTGGTNYTAASAVVDQAKIDLTAAYTNAAGQTPATTIVGDLGGQTFTPGIYNSATSIGLTGTVTLDAQGDPNAVFIFQAGSTLTTAVNSVVTLVGGAQSCNIYWQVGSSATLGTGTQFFGRILALSSITDNGGSTVNGRLLARNGAVTLNNTHVITQSCVAPPTASGGGAGGEYVVIPPIISVTKVPSPLVLPAGPGSVVYTYVVSNPGTVAMNQITATDNTCAPVTYISGDMNGNGYLDTTEHWTYRCTTNVSQTTTNTVTATGIGYSGGTGANMKAIATANATVVVGALLTPPLIHVIKVPDTFTLPAAGGTVSYRYTVTNPGTEPLHNVSIVDDKCATITGPSGDTNGNALLDPSETWIYTCHMNLIATTMNRVTVEGTANGLIAIAYALATVVVAAPGLPNTGFGPSSTPDAGTLLDIFVAVTVLASLLLLSRKLKEKRA